MCSFPPTSSSAKKTKQNASTSIRISKVQQTIPSGDFLHFAIQAMATDATEVVEFPVENGACFVRLPAGISIASHLASLRQATVES